MSIHLQQNIKLHEMKNLFFIAIFALASTFGFASNTEKNPAKTIENQTSVKKIDLKTLLQKVQSGELKGEIKYDAATKTFRLFPYTDSCGNSWEVDYSGMTFGEALMYLYALDGFLCSTGGVGSYTFYFY
jgi:hypothetical protein